MNLGHDVLTHGGKLDHHLTALGASSLRSWVGEQQLGALPLAAQDISPALPLKPFKR